MTKIPAYNYANDIIKYKHLESLDKTPELPDENTRAIANHYVLRRSRSRFKETSDDKLKALCGSIIGTVLPMALMTKKQGVKNPLKLKYGLREMIILSATSIMGGVFAGMIGSDYESKLNKSKEGIFQFLNAAIPTWLAAATLKWCESTEKMNNNFMKILTTLATILIGMQGAASVSNIICDPKDKHPDRKVTLLDSLANIDDLVGVLVLAKIPVVEKLHLDKLLPVIYSFCGYRAGKSN